MFFGLDFVDCVYFDIELEMLLYVGSGVAVSVENIAGWTDTVIWNSYTNMKECYKNFCCVESVVVLRLVVVVLGKVWCVEMNLIVIDVVLNDV